MLFIRFIMAILLLILKESLTIDNGLIGPACPAVMDVP